jgi:hypothetical protein
VNPKPILIATCCAIAFVAAVYFGGRYILGHGRIEAPTPDSAKVPLLENKEEKPGPTAKGHWHGDVWHPDDAHDAPNQTTATGQKLIEQPSETKQRKYPVGPDWDKLSPEERRKRWTEAYRSKWGDDPSWNGEYRHVYDCKGIVRRYYRNKYLLTQYQTQTGFAPNPAELERYLNLKEDYHSAESVGDFPKATSIREEMQKLVDSAQGEIPVPPYGLIYYGAPSLSPEEERLLGDEATKELYKLMGIEHLYEFYETIPLHGK